MLLVFINQGTVLYTNIQERFYSCDRFSDLNGLNFKALFIFFIWKIININRYIYLPEILPVSSHDA